MGYYTIMTSELDMGDHDVIDKYHGLSKIEVAFRITKRDTEGRPVFVRNYRHINAHFLICIISLTMIRIIQYMVLKSLGKKTNSSRDWEMGLSAERIQNALRNFTADALSGGFFRLTKPHDDLEKIAAAVGVDVALRIPTEAEIRKLKYEIDRSILM